MLKNINCAVYEIADALHISDENVELIDKANQEHLERLKMKVREIDANDRKDK